MLRPTPYTGLVAFEARQHERRNDRFDLTSLNEVEAWSYRKALRIIVSSSFLNRGALEMTHTSPLLGRIAESAVMVTAAGDHEAIASSFYGQIAVFDALYANELAAGGPLNAARTHIATHLGSDVLYTVTAEYQTLPLGT